MSTTSIWKVLSFFGVVSAWASQALQPDSDGVVRITVKEMADLASKMCRVFGWSAEIVVPAEEYPENPYADIPFKKVPENSPAQSNNDFYLGKHAGVPLKKMER